MNQPTVYPTRAQMMKALCPPNSHGIEIGVQRGYFARQLLDYVKPDSLILLDAWQAQPKDIYHDPANGDQAQHDEYYAEVEAGFKNDSRVRIVRAFSPEFIYTLATRPFDWAFIDGNHSYPAVLADLLACERIVKPGGIIAGHDYTVRHQAITRGYAVYDAVQAFIRDGRWQVVAITEDRDDWASFALKRNL